MKVGDYNWPEKFLDKYVMKLPRKKSLGGDALKDSEIKTGCLN